MLSVMYQEFMDKMREGLQTRCWRQQGEKKPSLPKKGKESHCHAYQKPKSHFQASSHVPSPSLYRRTMMHQKQHHHIHRSTSAIFLSPVYPTPWQPSYDRGELIGIDCECMSRHMVVHPASPVPFALVLNDTLAASQNTSATPLLCFELHSEGGHDA